MEKIVKPSLFHDRNVEQKPKSTFKRQNGFVVVLSMIILLITVFFVPIRVERSFEYHVKKMAPLIEKRYFSEDTEYTGYTVYPLYDEYDKLSYFLIDFEPHGYAYVELISVNLGTVCNTQITPYQISGNAYKWHPYTVQKDAMTVIEKNGQEICYRHQCWQKDENGNYIEYTDSHFRVAGIQDEKRYFLWLRMPDEYGIYFGYVPAVKRNGKYINLISMEEMDYTPKVPAAYPYEALSMVFDL